MASILFSAGDPSGDERAARLIEALKTKNPSLSFFGLGGRCMERAGMSLLDDLTQAAAIGPFDAAKHLSRLRNARRLLEARISQNPPDLAVLVDFGDYNLPVIAPMLKRHGVAVVYFISPQIWAWGRFRLGYVKRYVSRMLVLFKFEETFYRRHGVPVTWVGHPLVDEAKPSMSRAAAAQHFGLNPWRRTVGLLPGSRHQEIARHLPLMLAAARRVSWHMPGLQFLLVKAAGIEAALIERHLRRGGVDVIVAEGSVHDALQTMEAVVVASGTATLDAALCGTPMVVVYRTSWPTYWVARSLVRIPDIALVNVVAGRRIVPELVQHQATVGRIAQETLNLLRNDAERASMQGTLQTLTQALGEPGATERAANAVMQFLAARKN